MFLTVLYFSDSCLQLKISICDFVRPIISVCVDVFYNSALLEGICLELIKQTGLLLKKTWIKLYLNIYSTERSFLISDVKLNLILPLSA